jgi:hypothetical protein
MVNVQEWLDKNYPKNTRNKIVELDISKKDLVGSLNLSDFTNLKKLQCGSNKLSKLFGIRNIVYLDINDNLISDENIFESLSNELNYLDIRDNKFSQKDLSFLSRFKELRILKLGRKRINLKYVAETT